MPHGTASDLRVSRPVDLDRFRVHVDLLAVDPDVGQVSSVYDMIYNSTPSQPAGGANRMACL